MGDTVRLIIEVPKDFYKIVMDHKDHWTGVSFDAIVNGQLYDESGELISREYILKELEAHQHSKDFCIAHHIDYSIDLSMAKIIVTGAPGVTISPTESRDEVITDTHVSNYDEENLKDVMGMIDAESTKESKEVFTVLPKYR